MNVEDFKSKLAVLVNANRNSEAIEFVLMYLPVARLHMSAPDRLLIADWMEGVEMALDLGIDASESEPRTANSA